MNRKLTRAGQIIQGLALGLLLSIALVELLLIKSGGVVFRYQGF